MDSDSEMPVSTRLRPLGTTLLKRSCRPFSTSARQLLRDFIHDSLYNPGHGYFAASKAPVSCLPSPFDFRILLGRDGYNYALDRVYKQLQVVGMLGRLCGTFSATDSNMH